MDLASLGIAIDSTSVPPAVGRLDDLTAAGKRAEAAIDQLGDEAVQTGNQVKGASASASEYAANVQRMANNTRLSNTQVDGLGKATAAARANVNRLGSEIGQLSGSLVTGNLNASEAAGSIARMGAASGASLGAISLLAAAAGLLGAAFLGVRDAAEAADPGAKKLIATFGLTDKEIKKLTDTTVTWGDVTLATFDVLAEAAGTSTARITSTWSSMWKSIAEFGQFSIGVLLGAFAALVKSTYNAFANIAATIGNAFVAAGNFAIDAFEKLVNIAIGGANKVNSVINAVFGTKLAPVATVTLGRINKQFQRTAEDGGSYFMKTFDSVRAGFDRIAARADQRRDDRVTSQAHEILADRVNKAAKAHKERAKALKEEADAWQKVVDAQERYKRDDEISFLNDKSLNPERLDLPNMDVLAQLPDPARELLDLLTAVADQSQVTADIMRSAFGGIGGVFGDLMANIADYGAAQQYWAMEVAKDASKQTVAEKALASLKTKTIAGTISGLKGLFKEHSAGYKAMSAIEKAYAAFQAAQTIASIARDVMHTTSSVANSGVRAAADTAAGGAKIFSQLGVFAFPVVAAMIAVLAALGLKGRGGGGSSTPPISAEDSQAAAGTGTVLGDSKAKSDSIARSLEIVAENTNRDLQYTNEMLRALRNIDTSIAKMAGTVARQISVSGSMFDTSRLRLGTSGSNGFLGIGGSSTTRTLWDLGVQFGATSVGNIINNGISGQTFQVVQRVRRSNGFLGIGGGTSTNYDTTYGRLDSSITSAIQDVITSLRDGLVTAAGIIGIQGAEALLNGFQVNLGRISFKDMTGEQIEDQLNAIFSAIGDQMAGVIYPQLAQLQLVGEGLFETFIRVAKEYEAVDLALKSIGRTFGMVGIQSVAARDQLVQLFGGLEEFLEATDFFRDQFLTEAEQIAPIQASVVAELQRLGVAGITTRDQFKQAILGLDLTTAAGREMYASLLAVAPAFDKVLDYFDQVNKATISGLQSTIDQFTKFAESLKKYRETLFDTGAAQGNAYALLRQKFIDTAALAATGDATALGGLEGSAKSFLDAARNSASTREQYLRDVALVARGVDQGIFAAEETADYAQLQLDALRNATTILQQISANTAATTAALTLPAANPGASPTAPTSGATTPPGTQELIDQNATIIAQNVGIAGSLTRIERIFRQWDGDGLPEERNV